MRFFSWKEFPIVYDRSGKMVAQSIAMPSRTQFLEMLAQAGLQ